MKKGDSVTLSSREQRRLVVLNHLESGGLVNAEAAALLGLSVRQVRRLHSAYRQAGAAALAHGNRGRRPAHALDPELARRVVELASTTYQGFNQHHLTEMLREEHGLELSRVSVHRILHAAGIPAPRQRRSPRHRRRRDRYPRAGMLLQLDASRHDWLEGRGPYLSLVGAIDDATGQVPWACFRAQEDAHGYFQLLEQVVRRRGMPLAVYCDQHSIFWQTQDKELSLEEQLAGERPRPTQFGRLLEELDIQLILARSPQAKGRVERLWGTFQDRLGSELRLAGASTLEQAQAVLLRHLPKHNRRFAVAPSEAQPAWRSWPNGRRYEELFCFKYWRVVGGDNAVRFAGRLIDIPPSPHRPTYAHTRVEIQERFDGSLALYHQDHCLLRLAPPAPPPIQLRTRVQRRLNLQLPAPTAIPKPPKPPKRPRNSPADTHPWRLVSFRRRS